MSSEGQEFRELEDGNPPEKASSESTPVSPLKTGASSHKGLFPHKAVAMPSIKLPLPKVFMSWRKEDKGLSLTDKIRDEIFSFSKFFKRKLEKFLVVSFNPRIAEIVYVEVLPQKIRLLRYDTQPLSSDDQTREDVLVGFINKFIHDNNIEEKDVVISISDSESIFVRDFILPMMPDEEIRKAAKLQLKDDVSFDMDKASIDWQIQEEITGKEGEKGYRIIFIVANSDVINRCLSIVKKCSLFPLGITTGAFNYASVLEGIADKPSEVAILDVGHTESSFGIYSNNRLSFVRRLPISWEKLMQSLTKVLVSDSGVTQFTYEEAEKITRTIGIPMEEVAAVKGNIHASHLMSLMRPLLEGLMREIKFSLDYFVMNFEKDRPKTLYITGDSAGLKNLDKYLAREFGVEVFHLLLPNCVEMNPAERERLGIEDQNRIMNAIGAALGGFRTVNLLPLEVKTQRLELVEKAFLRFMIIVAGTIFIFVLSAMQTEVRNYQDRIKSAQQHLETMENVKVLAEKVWAKEGLINDLRSSRVPVEGIFKTLSMIIPPDIVLDALIYHPKEYRLSLRGTVLAGRDVAEDALAEFMKRLEESPFITDAVFVSSQRTGISYNFEIKCDVVH